MSESTRRTRDIQAPPRIGPETRQMGPAGIKVLLLMLSVIVLTVSGLGYFTVGQLGNTVASAGKLSLGGPQGVKEAADGAIDILLVGSDSRSDAHGNALTPEEIELLHAGDEENDNTDTIMVIRVPNDGTSATAISIPRDTYIHDETHGNMKINGVYGAHKGAEKNRLYESGVTDEQQLEDRSKQAGREALIQQITSLSGITIDHYAEVGLLGFVLLTDAVGGVDVCLNEDTYDEYSGADFSAGVQTLNGAQSLSFVRQRHGLPRGDLDRIVRQQAFMASLVNKVLSSGTLTNPSRLADMGNAVERSVIIDDDWDIMSFANQLQNLAGGNVTFNTIPVTSIDGVGDYGESVVTINPSEVKAFFEKLLDPEHAADQTEAASASATTSSSSVQVLNASYTEGLAQNVATALKAENFNIAGVANASAGLYDGTQVRVADPTNAEAQRLAALLGDVEIVEDSTLDADTIIAIVDEDYAGPSVDSSASDDAFEESVGQPGSDAGEAIVSPEIDAGGNGPRCVN